MAKKMILLLMVVAVLGVVSCGNSKQDKTKEEVNRQLASTKNIKPDNSKTSEPAVKKIPVYMWECHRCGQRVKGTEQPSTMYCPTDTYHSWTKISETGYTTSDATPVYLWECRHCGEQVEGTSMPGTNHCPVDTYHSWIKKSRIE